MSAAAGYSGTPLPKKLGFKPGQTAAFLNLPSDLDWLTQAEAFAAVARSAASPAGEFDLIHAFYTDDARLTADLPTLRDAIRPNGAVWISWPKKAAKVATDITEDVIRAAALDIGLVDVKVCAVSDIWSGLKLVIPVALRQGRR
ncbi:MAG TPA: DUF3052 domain-containing protein [Caulobacteraceae bacterium]|jgi:hypothetical protein